MRVGFCEHAWGWAVVDQDERVNTDDPADPGAGDVQAEEPAPAGDTPAEAGTPEAPTSEPASAADVPPAAPEVAREPDESVPPSEKPHKRRRRRWVMALSIIGAVIVVLIIAAFVTAHYTSASTFCDGCHEMDPYYQSWQDSTHSSVECRECHIPPGALPYVQTKFGSFREIYVHFSSHPEAPLAVTRQIPNSNCLKCHEPPPDPTLPTVTFSHDTHSGQNCISCHVRFVHTTVNPPYYQDPAAMSSCLQCHNGSIAPSECTYCHTPPHEARGECSTCHNQQSWTGTTLQHPFPLTGAHANLACKDCHVTKAGVENIPGTELPKADPACISCHGDHHNGLTDCASCHTADGWQQTSFVHPQVGVHVPSGEHPLQCADCHQSGYASASCTPCHEGTPTGD
jgi:nitrate/TMAO reductase-like tetraheme cytochrome c subunit